MTADRNERSLALLFGSIDSYELVEPSGDTSLAAALVHLLKADPDVVFVLSDGYENAPAGRFDETVAAVRRIGI